MPEPSRDALLVAIVQYMRDGVMNRGIKQRNGGNATWWRRVALAMQAISGVQRAPNTWRELYRVMPALIKERPADLADSRELLDHILEHATLPEGTPVSEPDEPQWAPPPHRSDDPADRIRERRNQLLRDHDRNVAKKLVDQQALTELLVEAITEGVKMAPPIVVRSVPDVIFKQPAAEEVPVALLSDIHGGTLILPEEVGGLGEFNMDIFRRRLDTYQNRICTTIDLHRKESRIKKLVIKMLGDMIEGEVIFDGQAYRIELVVTDQLFEVASYLIGWLLGILQTGIVEEIHIVCIYGNHGRTTHKKGASKGHSNWDYVLYRHMQAVLANEPRIKWFIPKAWFALVDILGWKIYCSHGDEVKSWNGIPFYGIMRHDMRTTTLLQSVGQGYYGMVSGDKHVSATIPRVWGFQVMNGSIVGGSDFSMHLLGTASQPMQTMFGIHERAGRTWQYDMILDSRNPDEIQQHLALVTV